MKIIIESLSDHKYKLHAKSQSSCVFRLPNCEISKGRRSIQTTQNIDPMKNKSN